MMEDSYDVASVVRLLELLKYENGRFAYERAMLDMAITAVKSPTQMTELTFGEAFDRVKRFPKTRGMRLPHWGEDVLIKIQTPDDNSKMTAPYLYVESRYGRVPWKETMIELFANTWEVVDTERWEV